MPEKKRQVDYVLLLTILLLSVFGVIMITSIGVPKSIELTKPADVLFPTCGVEGVDCYHLLKNHLIRLVIGIVIFVMVSKIPYIFWKRIAVPFIAIMFAAMVGVLMIGQTFSTQARSWFLVFNNSVQPAEIAKLALIFYLAFWLERKGKDVKDLRKGFYSFCIISGIIILPLVLQPDLGSTMLFTLIAVGMYFLAGARYKHLLVGLAVAVLVISLILPFNSYLKYRFLAYVNPSPQNCEVTQNEDRRDYCWQTRQANIAVASGGLLGRGLTQGVQKSYWLPQAPDDFIFAASAEELGFLRIIFVVIAFAVIAYRGFLIARHAPDRFSMYTAVGITIWIVGQAFINIGVNTGILPVTGITLPYISYGGSSLVMSLVGAGVLLNISRYTNLNYALGPDRRRNRGSRYAKRGSYRRA